MNQEAEAGLFRFYFPTLSPEKFEKELKTEPIEDLYRRLMIAYNRYASEDQEVLDEILNDPFQLPLVAHGDPRRGIWLSPIAMSPLGDGCVRRLYRAGLVYFGDVVQFTWSELKSVLSELHIRQLGNFLKDHDCRPRDWKEFPISADRKAYRKVAKHLIRVRICNLLLKSDLRKSIWEVVGTDQKRFITDDDCFEPALISRTAIRELIAQSPVRNSIDKEVWLINWWQEVIESKRQMATADWIDITLKMLRILQADSGADAHADQKFRETVLQMAQDELSLPINRRPNRIAVT